MSISKRQIRLIIVLLVLLVTGVFIYNNFSEYGIYNTNIPDFEGQYISERRYGWPIWVYRNWTFYSDLDYHVNIFGILTNILLYLLSILLTCGLAKFEFKWGSSQATAAKKHQESLTTEDETWADGKTTWDDGNAHEKGTRTRKQKGHP